MGMVGKACLPSNAYYPRTPDYTLYFWVHVCWSEHSDSSFVYGFMSLDYDFGTITTTTYLVRHPSSVICDVFIAFKGNSFYNLFEPAHDKTYNKTCAICEDLDQPMHPRSLIRFFADRICLLQPQGYPRRDEQAPLPYWMDVQTDLSLLLTQVLL